MSTIALVLVGAVLASGETTSSVGQTRDPDLERGVREAQEGEYDRAVMTLDGVARRLKESGSVRALSRAYIYLGVAYLGLHQEQAARGSFLAALRASPATELSPAEYPPPVVRFFEEVRRSAAGAEPQARTSPPSPTLAPVKAKRGGAKLPLILLGGAGAVAGAAVGLKGGGGDDVSTGAIPATPTAVVVTGTLTLLGISPPAGSTIKVLGRSIVAGSGLLEVRFDVVTSADLSGATLFVELLKEGGVSGAYVFKTGLSFRAGQHASVLVDSFTLEYDPPFETTHMQVRLTKPPSEDLIATASFNSTGWAFTSR